MMSAILANRIVEAWDRDRKGMQVTGLLEYLKEHNVFQPIWVRIRVMLAAANPKASDALWDKNVRSAIIYLRRYGLIEHRSMTLPPEEQHYILNARDSGKTFSPGSDWKYVKAVRSK